MNVTSFPIAPSKTSHPSILLVQSPVVGHADDVDRNLSDLVRCKCGYVSKLERADDAASALACLKNEDYSLVILDARLSSLEALTILHCAAEMSDDVAVAVVAWDEQAQGEEWIQRGADDFIIACELSPQRIDVALAKAHRARRLCRENAHMHRQIRHAGREFEHFVRALSHDMMANFMLLESSFAQLHAVLDVRGNVEAEALPGATSAQSVQSAEDHSTDDELSRMLAHLRACLAESKRFLDDLVQLAKTGSVEMEPRCVALRKIVDEVLFEQAELLTCGGIEVNVAARLPVVWCNRQRLKQVVTNLVRNAIKHGCDPSNPQIYISAKSLPGMAASTPTAESDKAVARPVVLLRVYDNGAGIETRVREEIFLPGRRLSTASDEGSGMGLAIVRKIAEHYGGSAWVDRQTTLGTGIIVSLPAAVHDRAFAAGCRDSQEQTDHAAKRTSDQQVPAALHQSHRRSHLRH